MVESIAGADPSQQRNLLVGGVNNGVNFDVVAEVRCAVSVNMSSGKNECKIPTRAADCRGSNNICSNVEDSEVESVCVEQGTDVMGGGLAPEPPIFPANIVNNININSEQPESSKRCGVRPVPHCPTASQHEPDPSKKVQTTLPQWLEGNAPVTDNVQGPVLESWGDALPKISQERVLRLVYQNVAYSLHTADDDPGMAYFMQNLLDIQCGMALCSETNINWRRQDNVFKIKKRLQKSFQVHGSFSSSTVGEIPEIKKKMRLPGGAAVLTFDHWAATVVDSGSDPEGCGWWSYTTLQGRNKQFLTVICFYRSCKASNSAGATTAHAQTIYTLNKKQLDGELPIDIQIVPREASIRSLLVFILEKKGLGHAIMVGGDGNETPEECCMLSGPKKFSMAWLFEEAGLQDVSMLRHGNRPNTTTTTENRFIDWVGCWNVPVLRVARLGENYPAMSDHLGFAVDVDMVALFGGVYSCLTSRTPRRLSVKNAKSRNKYESEMLRQWEVHKLYERAEDLYFKSFTDAYDVRDAFALNRLDTQATEVFRGSERRCSKRTSTRDPWSPALRDCGKVITYWRARQAAVGRLSTPRRLSQLRRQAGVPWSVHNKAYTKKEIKQRLRQAWKLHRECREEADEARHRHLHERVKDLATRMQTSESKAAEMIAAHEASRARFRRIGRALGKVKKGLSAITVDDPVSGERVVLTEKEAIHEALLDRNRPHLQEPNYTKFGTLGSLFKLIDPDDSSQSQIHELLNGMAQLPPRDADDPELKEWIQELQQRNFEEIDLTINEADFVSLFKNMKESKESSPSLRHVGHYITIARMENPIIRRTLCMIAEIALRTGCPLDRWMNCTQVMLEKGKGNYINNLRIIQLLEADLNFVLRLVWGRRLNRAAKNKGIYDASQYAVPGSLCNSAALQKVLYLDLMRQCQETGFMIDFDAKAAYDSVIPALATVTCKRLGLPEVAGQFMATLVNQMEYRVCTAHGISKKSYNAGADPLLPCQGSFQGAGSSPMLYQSSADVSLTAYRKNSTGAVFYHPDPTVPLVEFCASQFVDDNTQQNNMEGLALRREDELEGMSRSDKEQLLLAATNENAMKWVKYTSFGGGLVNKTKSFVYFIKPTQDPDTGRYTYAKQAECPGRVVLPDHDDPDIVVEAGRYEAEEAQRTLGLMVAPDGNVAAEIRKQRDRVRKWATSLVRSDLSNQDKWVAYNSCIKPAVLYPMMGQQIDAEALASVQTKVDEMLCHALGLNSHFPRAVLHGPVELGGMGVPPLWVESLTEKLSYFFHHTRIADTVGQELKTSVAILQLELGCGVSFFELPFETWGRLATPCWVANLWKLCSRIGLQLRAAENIHWIPPLQSTGDKYIMDLVVDKMPRKQWCRLNYCRRFLQVVSVADLFLHDGSGIHPDLRQCRRPAGRLANYVWPDIPPPTKACISVWKAFLDRCVLPCQQQIQDDDWVELPRFSHDLAFRYHYGSSMLYEYAQGVGWKEYPAVPGSRSLRGVHGKCVLQAVGIQREYPAGAQPVEVVKAADAFVIVALSSRHIGAFRF